MDATALFLSDGRSAEIYFCGKCRIVSRTKEGAENCCKPVICDSCSNEVTGGWTRCKACRDIVEAKKEKERFEKAAKVEQIDGWVYAEGVGYNDGFFESIDALVEYCEDEEEDYEWPEYAYACDTELPSKPNIDDVIQRWIDNGYEGIEDHIVGEDELAKALDAFWQLNKGLVSYTPDYSKVMIINKSELKD